jgi:ElaB/YqjD/DUF883 family membrane-anchored ribosome-binding protein
VPGETVSGHDNRKERKAVAETRTANNSESDIQRLHDEIDKLRRDLSSLTDAMGDIAAGRVKASYEKLQRTSQEMQARASHTAEALAQEVEQRPLTFLAGAFGVGMLLGMLMRGRH